MELSRWLLDLAERLLLGKSLEDRAGPEAEDRSWHPTDASVGLIDALT